MPVQIPLSFFHWKLPFQTGAFTGGPQGCSGGQWLAQKKYPVEIKARGTEIFFLSSMGRFHETARQHLIGKSNRSRLRSRFLSAFVTTDDGRTFNVKVEPPLRRELAQLRKQKAVSG